MVNEGKFMATIRDNSSHICTTLLQHQVSVAFRWILSALSQNKN